MNLKRRRQATTFCSSGYPSIWLPACSSSMNSPQLLSSHSLPPPTVSPNEYSFFAISPKLNANNDYQLDYPVLAEGIASYVRSKIHTTVSPPLDSTCSLDRNQALPLASSHHRVSLRFWTSSHRVYLPFPIRACLCLLRKEANLPRHLPPRVLNRGNVETRYGMAVTGFAYDLIHGPALLNCGPNGCSLFAKGPNQQTMAEGLVTGGLCGNRKAE